MESFFILFFMLGSSQGGRAIETIPFGTEEQCLAAKDVLLEEIAWGTTKILVCLETDYQPAN